MRFSGSVYDNLRQRGVHAALASDIGRDRSTLRAAVLARLRFDDLLANDSIDDQCARVVLSFSDFLDGRLFLVLAPDDLLGLDLDVLCPQWALRDRASSVFALVRAWLQDSSGQGRPNYFEGAPASIPYHEVAENIGAGRNLDITKWTDVHNVLANAGYPDDSCDMLIDHWARWDIECAEGRFSFAPFRGGPAHAGPLLGEFLRRHKAEIDDTGTIRGWGLTVDGVTILREATRHLDNAHGARAVPLAYLDKLWHRARNYEDDARVIDQVRRICVHYMFVAIADANDASPEHSAPIGVQDHFALRPEYLEKAIPQHEEHYEAPLDRRIVDGLGLMSGFEYARIKREYRTKIARGVALFKRTQNDISGLVEACSALAQDIGSKLVGSKLRSEAWTRSYIWELSGAAAGSLPQIGFNLVLSAEPSCGADQAVESAGGAVLGALAAHSVKGMVRLRAEARACGLFSRSMVREAVRRLRVE